jgi:hypothetical protein
MTRIKIIGLTLVAVFAISAVVSASASALQWLLNGRAITSAVNISSKAVGTLLLADLAATGGEVALLCEGNDKGTAGPGAAGTVSEITATGCTFQEKKNGSCTASDKVTAVAVHLPWKTTLTTVGANTRIALAGTSGNPGWSVECTVGGIIKVQDTCTSSAAAPLASNVAGGVDATFESSETASCSLGNGSSGMVIGTDLNANPTGKTLTVGAG